jgi:hypothetical protein
VPLRSAPIPRRPSKKRTEAIRFVDPVTTTNGTRPRTQAPRLGNSQSIVVPRTTRSRTDWNRVFGMMFRPKVLTFFDSW